MANGARIRLMLLTLLVLVAPVQACVSEMCIAVCAQTHYAMAVTPGVQPMAPVHACCAAGARQLRGSDCDHHVHPAQLAPSAELLSPTSERLLTGLDEITVLPGEFAFLPVSPFSQMAPPIRPPGGILSAAPALPLRI